ncbi:MAG: M23 family metallopeptidase [Oscillospiraceae bacterium]
MKKKLFGALGERLKGNTLIVVLFLAVIAAGVFSYNTISDINQKLKNQNPQKIQQTPGPSPSEEVTDTQKEQNNVPLPKATNPPKIEKDDEEKDVDNVPEVAVPTEKMFILPVDGKIYSAFSGNELVYNRTLDDWRTHNGIDISAPKDAGVRAGAAGTVAEIYNDGMLGTVVEINHGAFLAKYCGLNEKTFIKKGDMVSQGQSIGTVGEMMLEVSDESHVHLEIIKNDQAVNPDTILH